MALYSVLCIFASLWFLGLALPAEILAARFHVQSAGLRQSGASEPGDWSPENCYASLALARGNAAPTDSLLLYNEAHFLDRYLILTSFLGNQNLDTNHENCRILLTGSAALATPINVAQATLRGISILGWSPASNWPALLIDNPGTVIEDITISHCLFQNNQGSYTDLNGGSSICAKGNGFDLELRIEDSIFVDNTSAGLGGAIFIQDGYQVTIARCEFRKNAIAAGSLKHGGAIGMLSPVGASSLRIADSVFLDNRAQGRGGAIYIKSGNLYLDNCDFLENRSNISMSSDQYQAPGVYMFRWNDAHDQLEAEIAWCRFVGNKAGILSSNYGGGDGGGFFAAGLDSMHRLAVHISDSLFEDNYNVSGAGIYIGRYATALVERSVFRHNTALKGGGGAYKGGAYAQSEGELGRFEYCLFEANQAGYDDVGDISPIPRYGRGGAVYCRAYPRVEIVNSTFVDNRAGGLAHEGDAFYHTQEAQDFPNDLRKCVLVNSLFFGSVGNDVQVRSSPLGFSQVTHCAYEAGQFQCDGVETTEIVTLLSSPFVAPGDHHLNSESSCIDAGTDLGLTQDIEGVPVPQGAGPDIGAFEFVNPNEPPVADDDFASVVVGGTIIIDVLDGDEDADGTLVPSSVTLGLAGPAHGRIDAINPATGEIVYTHTDLGSLSPDTFTYTVEDNAGAVSNEATVTVTVIELPPLAFTSDDFNTCSLDTMWTFIDTPVGGGGGSASMVGGYTGNAQVEITVPGGATHQMWNRDIEVPYIIQAADDTSFILEVKWDSSVPVGKYHQQGIIVKNVAGDKWLRLEFFSNSTRTVAQVALPDNSLPVFLDMGTAGIAPLWMRIARTVVDGNDNDVWKLYYSTDGTSFADDAPPFVYEMTVAGVGLYAGNAGTNPEHTAVVDYLMAKNAMDESFASEDTGEAGLNITVVGSGAVTPNPDAPSYTCNQPVQLTADPDPGWQFDSWSGGLTGSENPATLFMSGPMAVTATFVPSGAGNTVAIDGSGVLPLSTMNSCAADIPITIERTEFADLRLFTVNFELKNLALCEGLTSITEGTYLSDAGATQFSVIDNGSGSYTVDGSIQGLPCGATAATGTLFAVDVTNAIADGMGSIILISVILRDCDYGDLAVTAGSSLEIPIDTTPPAPVADLLAQQLLAGNPVGTTTAIDFFWTAPAEPGVVSQDVYRKGVGFYPEYDDAGGAVPTLPADPIGEGWEFLGRFDGTADSYRIPEGGDRDYWFGCIVLKDAVGNASVAMTNGQLNYMLADVSAGGVPLVEGDNEVRTVDVSRLGYAYGTSAGEALYENILDVGPTEDSRTTGLRGDQYSLPKTDNFINIDDLMIFSLSYGMNAGPVAKRPFEIWSSPPPADRNYLLIVTPAVPEIGQTMQVLLRMTGNGQIQGLSLPLLWNENVVEPLGVQPGELLAAQGGMSLVLSPEPGTIDVALMGVRENGIAGEGILGEVTFRLLAAGDPKIDLGEILARDQNNQSVDLMAEIVNDIVDFGLTPQVTALHANIPNPFNPQTTIAFDLARTGYVKINIYGVDGRLVRTLVDGTLPAGRYAEVWNGTDQLGRRVSSGVYLYRLESQELNQARRMLLLK